MKKVLLLVNGNAGTGASKLNLYDILENLAVHDCMVTAFPILPEKGLTAERLIEEYGADFDTIMCAGGDGTLSHTIRGIMNAGLRKPIAYLPCGSTNDYARSLGISASVPENCAAAAGNRTTAFDIGRFNDSYFNYVAAFGAFTKVSYSTSQLAKNYLGYAAYILEGLLTLPENISSRCRMRISYDGGQEEGSYLYGAITNSISVGGMASPVSQRAKLNDGLFEVMLVSAPENLGIVELGDIVTTLASGSTDSPYIRVFQTGSLQIEAMNHVDWTLDGEYGGCPQTVKVEVCRRAVRMLV